MGAKKFPERFLLDRPIYLTDKRFKNPVNRPIQLSCLYFKPNLALTKAATSSLSCAYKVEPLLVSKMIV
jgi:hypothetical protein